MTAAATSRPTRGRPAGRAVTPPPADRIDRLDGDDVPAVVLAEFTARDEARIAAAEAARDEPLDDWQCDRRQDDYERGLGW